MDRRWAVPMMENWVAHVLVAQGPGGQHVNKASTDIHLRFDIATSSLPVAIKERLLARSDSRISADGVLVINALGRAKVSE